MDQQPKPRPSPPNARRRTAFLLAVGGVALALGLAGLVALWQSRRPPRLNDQPASIARFAASKQFGLLPFDQQRQYMNALEKQEDALRAAYEAGRLTAFECRTALELGWLNKHLGWAEKYASLPSAAARAAYVDELLAERTKGAKSSKSAKAAKPPEPKPKTPLEIKRDEDAAEQRVQQWPADAREQWERFHQAYRGEKSLRKARKSASSPAAN